MVSGQVPDEVALLMGLFANSPNFIGLAGLDRKGIFLNRAGRLLVGLDLEEDINKREIMEFFPEEDRAYIGSVAIPSLLEEGSWNGEVRFKHFTTGQYIPMMWDAFVVPNLDTRRPSALGCISWDLSELKTPNGIATNSWSICKRNARDF
jgi:PAS domain-containing protein